MLAFLDSPVQLVIAAVVILLVFGPDKLPEIMKQAGRALREFKRTTSELQDTLTLDSTDHNRYEEHYNPPTYDSYGNPTTGGETHTASVPEADVWHPSDTSGPAMLPSSVTHAEPVYGDFAASALSEGGSEYGVVADSASASHGASAYAAPSSAAGVEIATPRPVVARPAEGSVSRQS